MTARDDRRDQLFDYAVATTTMTIHDIAAELDVPIRVANEAVHDLRIFLGDFDSMNFPCEPDPDDLNGPWLYRLAGTLDDVRLWATNRVGDAETRLRTIQAMLTSIVRATDGRTTEGRRARVMETALRHLVEDLDLMAAP
jgi:hypothetical protein